MSKDELSLEDLENVHAGMSEKMYEEEMNKIIENYNIEQLKELREEITSQQNVNTETHGRSGR